MPLRRAVPVRAVVRKQTASPFGGKGPPLHQPARCDTGPV